MNGKKFLTVVTILLVVLMFVCHADENKVGMKSLVEDEWTEWGSFNMEGRNFTPPRLVDTDEYEYLEVKAKYETDKLILFTLGAYSISHDVLGQFQTNPPLSSGEAIVKLRIEKGQQIQVFTQIWGKDGEYDDNYPVDIELYYRLVN